MLMFLTITHVSDVVRLRRIMCLTRGLMLVDICHGCAADRQKK